MMKLYGVKIIESPYLVKQVETDRSRKRRAKKRWAKARFLIEPDLDAIFQTPGGIICHPIVANQLRKELERSQEASHD